MTCPNSPAPRWRYVTTAIPYVNGAPHIGFALELFQADSLARFYRQAGHRVRLQAGTDENSLKNVEAARAAGLPVATLVARNAERFQDLKQGLGLSTNDFIRTSVDPRHRAGVETLWAACLARGDLYKRAYRGLYCTGCEQFYRPDDLVDGLCPEHGSAPEEIAEENWFFRLSRYAAQLTAIYDRGEIEIVPEPRRNEVLAWLERGLEDISVSRNASRAEGWGIPVPGDPQQVIYVWFDALANYVTALGYGSAGTAFETCWRTAERREHVIGKGITRFHALYWPAILLSAGLPLPTRLLVHGYLTVDGRKIGKSAGNAIDPEPLAERYGPDALRYALLRHIRSGSDGDFSEERFEQAYRSELAGQLGNLAHRTLTMIERYRDGVVPPRPPRAAAAELALRRETAALPARVAAHIEAFAFHLAFDAIWHVVAEANRTVSEIEPWALARTAEQAEEADIRREAALALDDCLNALAEALQAVACALVPLLPETASKLAGKLGHGKEMARPAEPGAVAGRPVRAGQPLFPLPGARS